MKTFNIGTYHSGFWREITINLYNTRKQMITGIEAIKSEEGEPVELEDECMGYTEGWLYTRWTHDDVEVTKANVGRISLNKKDLTINVLTHEIYHAVWNIYGFDRVKDGDTAAQHFELSACEHGAYMMGHLFEQAYELLKEYIINK